MVFLEQHRLQAKMSGTNIEIVFDQDPVNSRTTNYLMDNAEYAFGFSMDSTTVNRHSAFISSAASKQVQCDATIPGSSENYGICIVGPDAGIIGSAIDGDIVSQRVLSVADYKVELTHIRKTTAADHNFISQLAAPQFAMAFITEDISGINMTTNGAQVDPDGDNAREVRVFNDAGLNVVAVTVGY